jgi:hypothetical protein
MKVRLQPPIAQDALYLIKTKEFMLAVDHADLVQRNSQRIDDAYHETLAISLS